MPCYWLLSSRGDGMGDQKSAEAVVCAGQRISQEG